MMTNKTERNPSWTGGRASASIATCWSSVVAPRLHPELAEIYRQKVDALHAELNRPELRAETVEILRGLIEEIRLVPAAAG